VARAIGTQLIGWSNSTSAGVSLSFDVANVVATRISEEFVSYDIAYDVSQVAVDATTCLAREVGLQYDRFQQRDMPKWNGDSLASLVLVEECFYYLSASETEKIPENLPRITGPRQDRTRHRLCYGQAFIRS
jgi:hypothetical protein